MSAGEKKLTGSPETLQTGNIASKFRAYKLSAENTKSKLREAEAVIEELKNEIELLRNAEKDYRSQIFTSQSRLICLQETLKKFVGISGTDGQTDIDQHIQNQKNCQKIQERIQEYEEIINEIRYKLQNLLKCATREAGLLNTIKELESGLKERNSTCDFMKMEIQTLNQQKEIMETKFQEKINSLENAVENLQKKDTETQTHCRETLLYYKQQIEDYEQKIAEYERERKSFLEDFELPKLSEVNSEKHTRGESTVNSNTETRILKTPNSRKRNKSQLEPDSKIFHCSSFVEKSKKFQSKKSQNLSKMSKKQIPSLEFLSQDSSLTVISEDTARKRRLFSTNCNHYID